MSRPITTYDGLKESIQAIGQDLIDKAEEISRDIKNVTLITIHAEITPTETINYDVTKNYYVTFEEKIKMKGDK